jgi:hypothetical protein
VPELIVKLFEMIDIEHKNGEGCLAISFRASKFSLQRRLHEGAHEGAIEELRQRIADRSMFELGPKRYGDSRTG